MKVYWVTSALIVMMGCSVSRAPDDKPLAVGDPVGAYAETAQASRIATGATTEDATLLAAALTGDPDVMAAAIVKTAAACHGAVTCPAYGSCGTWSAAAACGGKTCGVVCGPCLPKNDPNCEPPIASIQPTEQYRVCFNAVGASCTEWHAGTATRLQCRDPLCADF